MAKNELGAKTHRKQAEQPVKTKRDETAAHQKHASAEPEHEQERVGNSQIAASLQQSADDPNENKHGRRKKKNSEKEGPEHGGEDDPFSDDQVMTAVDLLPTPRAAQAKSNDATRFLEMMTESVLPPADERFLQRLQTSTDTTAPERAFSPSPELTAARLQSWLPALSRHRGRGLFWDLCAAILQPLTPVFHTDGSLLIARSAALALAELIFIGDHQAQRSVNGPWLNRVLELHGRADRVHDLRARAHKEGRRLPLATELFTPPPPTPPEHAERAATLHQNDALKEPIESLLSWPDPLGFVPLLRYPEAPEAFDDPLGVDSIIHAQTKEGDSPETLLSQAAVQGAERLASACVQLRTSAAAVATIITESLTVRREEVRHEDLVSALDRVDTTVRTTLNTLVEIARAAKRQHVPVRALQNGLRRCAKRLNRAKRQLVNDLCALMPAAPMTPLPAINTTQNEVLERIKSGGLSDALSLFPECASLSSERFILLSCQLAPPIDAPTTDATRAVALNLLRGATMLRSGHALKTIKHARERMKTAQEDGRPFDYANAALLELESMSHLKRAPQQIEAHHLERAQQLVRMGQIGAITLLARWRPPDTTLRENEH